jgi:hypothetical protein
MHTSGASRREIANEYLRLDTALVPRMLRSAISAFTRVFDALCLRRDGLLAGAYGCATKVWVPALRSSAKGAAPRPGHNRLCTPRSSHLLNPGFKPIY